MLHTHRRSLRTMALAILACLSFSQVAHAQEHKSPRRQALALQKSFRKLAREARPKTVCVLGMVGSGSGATVSPEGMVVTNAHVAAGSRYAVMVYHDGRKRLARRLGIDYGRDLAVFRLESKPKNPLPYFKLADKRAKAGSWVVGIGYPGGPRSNSTAAFSVGLVKKGQGPGNVQGVLNYDDATCSDLPLFPGNSGGPMVDMQGRLIGINGAVDLQGGTSFSIPIERVKQRLKSLREDVIMLPQEQRLDLAKNPLARMLFRLIDPVVKRTMESRLHGKKRRLPEMNQGPRAPSAKSFKETDSLALKAQMTMRNRWLGRALLTKKSRQQVAASVIELIGTNGKRQAYATAVTPSLAVTVLDRLGGERIFGLKGRGQVRVVAIDKSQNLALLSANVRLKPLPLGLKNSVGTLAATIIPGATPIAGNISVPTRSVNARQASAIASSGGFPAPIKRALETVKGLAQRLRNRQAAALIDQILQSTKMREAYMKGSAPRGYRAVLSHDAPLAPSQVGTPLVNARGDLLAINVANAHFGTSYAVSVRQLFKAFPQLHGGKDRPSPLPRRAGKARKARLY